MRYCHGAPGTFLHRVALGQSVFHQVTNPETVGLYGAWRLATGHVPLGGLGRFRMATLRLSQAIMLLSMA